MPASATPDQPTEPLLRLEPGMHGAPIRRIDVDAPGRFLVTGSDDRTVRVWSQGDGQLLKTLRVPLGEGNVGQVRAVAITPDGERIAAGGWGPGEDGLSNSIYVFERAGGRIVARVDGLPNVVNRLAFSPDGRHLVACLGGSNGIRIYETGAFQEIASDRDYGGASYWAAFDRAGRLVTSSYDGKIRLFDPGFRLNQSKEAPGGKRPFGVAFSPDGTRIAVGYEDSTRVDVLDGETLAPLFVADASGVDSGSLGRVAWSADGLYLYAGGLWSKSGKYPVRRWADGGRGAYEDILLSQNTIMDLRPLADGRLAFGAADPSLGVLGADGKIVWRQDPAQADFRGQYDKLAVSPDGTRVAFGFEGFGEAPAAFDLLARRLTLDSESDPDLATARTTAPGIMVEDWRVKTTPTLNGKPLSLQQYETSRSLAIAPDGERFLLGADWYLRLFDRRGQQVWEKPVPGVAWAVNVSRDGRLAVAAFGDGTIRWFRLADGEELLAFFPHLDRQRWVVWTPEGYYMASPGGEELIGWHVNHGLDTPEFYSASRFRDRFHRPDVVALVLEELDVAKALARANREAEITPAPAPPLEEILPPVVQILDPTVGALIDKDPVAICWRVWAPGGEPITTLRIMINGTLAATFVDPNPADLVYLPVINRARSGRALISLIAESARGASDPASIGLQIAAAAAAKAPPPPRLFVLAVGVARYRQNPPDHLKYAARDAEDIATFFQRQKGRLYRDVSAQALMDDEATREAITGAILGLFDQVSAGDVVMIFFSGHGVVERDVYYYLAHDANPQTQVKLRMTAIDEHQLTDCFKTLFDRQAKVYAFFDTCYAGALGNGSKAAPIDVERFASKLGSEENGVVVFTSCTAHERSNERDEWQNGAFTEALLEALNGKAARQGERDILLSDVERYLKARVPELTGRAQTPKVYIPFKEFIDPPIAVIPE